MDSNKTAGEEARRQLHKNAASNLEQVLFERQHPTRHQLYGHLPPITKTIQVRRTRHAGHCWRSRDELISDVLLCTPTHGCAKAGRPARTYIQQLCEDTGCCPEDLPRAMNDREEWRERVRDIRATSTMMMMMMMIFPAKSYFYFSSRMALTMNNPQIYAIDMALETKEFNQNSCNVFYGISTYLYLPYPLGKQDPTQGQF